MARDGVRGGRVAVERAPSRLDPLAPDWLVRVLAPKRAPVPWADMVRVAFTLVAPLALGVLVGQPGLGVYGSMGALAGALADRGGARGERMARVVSGVGFGAVGIAVGRAATGTGAVPVVVVALAAAAAALLSAQSATLSFGGLQLLVSVGIAGGLPGTLPTVTVVAGFLAGGALAFLTSWAQSLLQHTGDVDRDAVVAVVRALARLLREPGGRADEPGGTGLVVSHRRALTEVLDAAHDRLARARAVSPGRRDDLRALSAVLTATSPLVSACVAYARTGRGDAELADLVDRLGDAVATGDRTWQVPGEEPAAGGAPAGITATRSLLHDAVLAGVTRVADALGGGAAGAGAAGRGGGGRLILGRSAWTFVARLTLTMVAAEIVRQVVPVERSYWILLTAALVLKPDFGSVFARGVQRTLGTLVGVVVGAAVLAVVPSGPWTLLPIAVFAAFAPFGIARNYGLFSTFLTPVVLLLIDFGRPVGADVALDRLLDTVLGAGVVLVVGYLCWPSTWRPRLGARVGVAVASLTAYARAAFGPDRPAAGAARRAAYRALSDLRAALQSSLSEPPPVSTRAAAWWPFVVQLERAVDALTNAMVLARAAGHPAPADGDVAALVAALDDLGAAVRDRRPPRPVPLPEDPALAGVVADLEGARRLLTAPDA